MMTSLHPTAGIGFWWAIVTLTSVGYGDRVPKTKQARLFATLWIVGGIMILALLQGTVRVSDRNLHSMMPLDPTHVRLKLEHAWDQCHS
jgi:voltage-gated potassium channel Kch